MLRGIKQKINDSGTIGSPFLPLNRTITDPLGSRVSNISLVWCSRRLAWEMSSTSHRVWTASLQVDILLSSILLVLIVWAMVAARWRTHTLNGCKKLKITQWMVARKTVYCKSFSYCKPPEGLFIWSTFADFVSRLFQTPEVWLVDTLRYKLVSQGTLQVTEVDNAWFLDVDMIPFTLSD